MIEDVYKGSQWQDTCLGELVFTPAALLRAQLATDSFLKDHWGEITGE